MPSDIGPARLGVRWIDEGPPARAEIVVMPRNDGDGDGYEVTLGGTFPVGDETWRFADVDVKNADEWRVIVRRVDEVMAPPTGRPGAAGHFPHEDQPR
ncbi:DUF6406 domain-containing protein [Micromonospora sp. NPDC049171]|uniref:DUF6406 domain-containing protein n=1 Tax=Micromonospora sp. NPDC049171 TaxID=3155770 RepID=UPI0033EF8377